jgi:endonuclease/exonuclease/phosphatase (EEP) superfamily protein YafD
MSVARRLGALSGWALVATGAGIVTSPWVPLRVGRRPIRHGRVPTLLVMGQSLVQWAGLLAAPAAAVAVARRDRRLGVTSAGLAAAGAAAAAWVNGRTRRAQDASTASLSIAHFNLLYINDRLAGDVDALARTDADVLTFCELTPRHLRTLESSVLAERYPFRLERPGPYATGTGLWSRFPVRAVEGPELEHHTVAADVDAGPLGCCQVVVIHTRSPLHHVGEWIGDLAELAARPVPADRPAVVIGDFNAAWGHAGYRAVVRAGWRDAHRELGRGLTNSWPTDRRWARPFVRLDHAVVNAATEVVDAIDVDVAGSDHRGIVVSVRPARAPGR